jgi:pimeloyl-ACP methyl ester carboxylesterase
MKKILFGTVLLALVYSFTSFSPAGIPYGDHKEAGHYIVLNGVKHYYEVYGQGQPMLLIHGNVTGIKGWSPQIEYFSKSYKVYAIDCRGRGKSDIGRDSLSYSQMAADMAAFVKQMHLDSVNVVGKSDGGIVAILMGIYYPTHIRKIVAYGANMTPDTNALYPPTVEDARRERRLADQMLAKKDTSKNWYIVQQRNRMMEFQPHITAAELRKIYLPVLVMSCDRDVIREEHTFFIYQNIPKSNLCILPNEVHRMPGLNPALFNSVVEKYLTTPFMEYSRRFK